jgi:hypothetical protein
MHFIRLYADRRLREHLLTVQRDRVANIPPLSVISAFNRPSGLRIATGAENEGIVVIHIAVQVNVKVQYFPAVGIRG